MRNSLVIKLTIIFLSCIGAVLLASYIVKIARNSNSLTYNLGKNDIEYSDVILKNYNDYESLVKKYNIKKDLTSANFSNKYYLASFQEYDSCAESKYKLVSGINIEDNEINVTYNVFNKCGWCKKNIILYLIEINKIDIDAKINYTYNYQNQLNCGKI